MRILAVAVLFACLAAPIAQAQVPPPIAVKAGEKAATVAAKELLTAISGFREKLAGFCNQDGLCGYMDTRGRMVIKPLFKTVTPFHEGYAAVELADKWGLIDAKGRYVINPTYDGMGAFVDGVVPVKTNNHWTFVNAKNLQKVVDYAFTGLHSYSEGLAAFQGDGKWGYMNREGRFAVKPKYDDAGDFSEGLAPVLKGKKWGYIDKHGKEAIPFQFDQAGNFHNKLAAVQTDGKWGYIGKNGNFAIPPQYDQAGSFDTALAPAKTGLLWGYITTKGDWKIAPAFSSAEEFSGGLAKVGKDGKAFFITASGADAAVATAELKSSLPSHGIFVTSSQTDMTWNFINLSQDDLVIDSNSSGCGPGQGMHISSFSSVSYADLQCIPNGNILMHFDNAQGRNEQFSLNFQTKSVQYHYVVSNLNPGNGWTNDGNYHYNRFASSWGSHYNGVNTIVAPQHTACMYTVDIGATTFFVTYDTDPGYQFSQQALDYWQYGE